jgi:site-specific recombinase XerD
MSLPTRPGDAEFDRDTYVAMGFLARYREPTRSLYGINLRQWFDWCKAHGIVPLAAQRVHIEMWAREMEEVQGKALSTVSNKLNTVAGFYRLARFDRHIVDDPAEYLRRPSVPRQTTTKALTRSELLRCFELAQQVGFQEHALWCLLGLNGLRIGEALALNVEDLGRQGGYRTLMVTREKGNRSGLVPLAPRTSWAFDLHLGTRTVGPLFRMRTGERMDRQGANRVVQRVIKKAGIQKRITPHSLRHTFMTLALDAGVSVRDAANTMGYSDTRMVSYYDHGKENLPRNATHFVAAFVEGS